MVIEVWTNVRMLLRCFILLYFEMQGAKSEVQMSVAWRQV